MDENPRFWVVFSILCAAIALCAVMSLYMVTAAHASTGPVAPQIIDVQDDPGGNVLKYYKNYQELSKQGAIIRLHGFCASACALVLLREYTGIKACAADERAFFAFHKPFAFDKSKKILKTKAAIRVSRAMWAEMLADFPYDVYNLLKDARIPSASEGDSPNDLFVVPAIFFVPKCGAVQ